MKNKPRKYKREIRRLKEQVRLRENMYYALDEEYRRAVMKFNERLAYISTQAQTIDNCNGVAVVEVKPEMYGTYICTNESLSEELESAKKYLAQKLAEGFLENNLVQFIIKKPGENPDPLVSFATLCAKMFVIPWEKMVRSVKVDFSQFTRDDVNG